MAIKKMGMEVLPTVFVVEDDSDARRILQRLFQSVDMAVQVYSSAEKFLHDYNSGLFGCLILDVRMPGLSGIELHQELLTRGCCIPVIITTAHGDVETAVRAMKAGAFDFMEKPLNHQRLLERVHQAFVHATEQRRQRVFQDTLRQRYESLTPREQEILERIVDGHATKRIALELQISEKTVETHRARIMKKMQAKNLAELVRLSVLCKNQNLE